LDCVKGFWISQAANRDAVQYEAAGENVSLKKFRRQYSNQCVNASDNQGGPV